MVLPKYFLHRHHPLGPGVESSATVHCRELYECGSALDPSNREGHGAPLPRLFTRTKAVTS
jgi:hypothetical protein